MLAPFEHKGEYPYEIHRDLQETMQSLVGIFRNEEDLRKALEHLEQFKPRLAQVRIDGSRMFNPGWHLTRDMRSMLLISEAVTRSALARQESRGAHSRIERKPGEPRLAQEHAAVGGSEKRAGGPLPERCGQGAREQGQPDRLLVADDAVDHAVREVRYAARQVVYTKITTRHFDQRLPLRSHAPPQSNRRADEGGP